MMKTLGKKQEGFKQKMYRKKRNEKNEKKLSFTPFIWELKL